MIKCSNKKNVRTDIDRAYKKDNTTNAGNTTFDLQTYVPQSVA